MVREVAGPSWEMKKRAFDFGRNWSAFSRRALTPERVDEAKAHFAQLLDGVDLNDRTFLDIGFGQGLSLLVAASMGARTVGCDISPVCAEVFRENRARYFPELGERAAAIVIGSILDDETIKQLRTTVPAPGEAYDIVHSWGALHHTGNMRRAICNAASLVGPGGHLILAIYRRHWSSGVWATIKRFYNSSPAPIQRLIIAIFYPVIYLTKWLVLGQNPMEQTRGMDFYYNVVDWVGGYPYEYATVEDVTSLLDTLGFEIVRINPALVPIGCNEFVFRRRRGGKP